MIKNKKTRPFRGIQLTVFLILLFVIIVTVGMFALMILYRNSQKTDTEVLGSMQSVTLAVTAISVSLITGIVTILVFYRERKTELQNELIEVNLSKIAKEREFLSMLIYLQSNTSRYMLGLQYKYLVDVGNNICDAEIDGKHQFIYIVCSLLETQAISSRDSGVEVNQIYEQIIRFSNAIIQDNTIKEHEKINAVFAFINANYRVFREDFDKNYSNVKAEYLNKAIECLEKFNVSGISMDNKLYSAQLNLIGLVYYWKFNYLYMKQEYERIEDMKSIIKEAVNKFERAIALNNNNEQIYNNYGCGLIGLGKYYALTNAVSSSKKCYDQAAKQFEAGLAIFNGYEKPYINLIDICCLRIKLILKLTGPMYLLSGFISVKGSFDDEINEQIKIGESYFQSAESIGKMLYNVYYKMAELEIFKLLLFLRKKDASNVKRIKQTVMDYLDRSARDKQIIKSLERKRQLYELCKENQKMKGVNEEIRKSDSDNAEKWDALIKETNRLK